MTLITQKTAFYVGHIEQLRRHFYFESEGCFVFGNDAQRHANKGAQQKCDVSVTGIGYALSYGFPQTDLEVAKKNIIDFF